jgi:enoyl-CoA hydratase
MTAVLSETVSRTSVVTLNRPSVRNAINGDLLDGLRAAMAAADGDPDTDVIVLTGADPAFCAGVDLKAVAAGDPLLSDVFAAADSGSPRDRERSERSRGVMTDPWTLTAKPVVGAVNGPAVTGGLEIALYCDLLIASERASFADTHARVGVLPAWALSVRLPEAVGFQTALRMSLTSVPLGAAAARSAGLVTEVVPHDRLLASALALAAEISRGDQAAVRALLASYREGERALREAVYATELRNARAWAAGHLDLAEAARRRGSIIADGSAAHGSTVEY